MSIDLSKCPNCGGPADNGHDRCLPPNPYYCTRCSKGQPLHDDDAAGHDGADSSTDKSPTQQPVDSSNLQWVEQQEARAEMAASVDILTFKKALAEIRLLHVALQTSREVSDGWQRLYTKLRDSEREYRYRETDIEALLSDILKLEQKNNKAGSFYPCGSVQKIMVNAKRILAASEEQGRRGTDNG